MPIRYEVDDQVVLITIDRPEARNALDPADNTELGAAVAAFEDDDSLRVAVLTGAGDVSFCAGADLKELIPPYREAVRGGEEPPWNFGGFTNSVGGKPKIAAINGHALAGGLEIALACDLRIAAANATLGLAETRWAIIPGAGGTVRLPRAVPLGIALEMIMTGDPIDAERAERVGLVNRVVALPDLRAEALQLARALAQRGPLAVRAARRSVLHGLDADFPAAMEFEHQRFLELMRTEDAVEGPTAFAEKRAPRYRGR